MTDPILSVQDLTVVKGNHVILDKITFEVEKNETVAIIGPNGAGKTTLFKALLDLIPYEGKITWKKDTKIGYVPQKLFIEEDLPISTYEFFSLKSKSKQDIMQALKSVGLAQNENHILLNKLGMLSGGELQRVLIAWALLDNPDVILFDEPTSGVDMAGEETVYALLARLQKEKNLTILLISHEVEIMRKITSKVLCLNKEKVCFGPAKTLDKKVIDKLFGEEVNFYEHTHKH
jgi:zinc transport system ATP-binding protein